MVKDYGSRNGYGWKMNEVIGAQVVSVPIGVPQSIARKITLLMMGSLAAVLLLTLVILNLMLHFIVVNPVKKLASAADQISKGNIEVDDLPVHGEDEIATLSGSFNRMLRSLKQAIKMLDGS
jgi:protein-histidine pros-kinase